MVTELVNNVIARKFFRLVVFMEGSFTIRIKNSQCTSRCNSTTNQMYMGNRDWGMIYSVSMIL